MRKRTDAARGNDQSREEPQRPQGETADRSTAATPPGETETRRLAEMAAETTCRLNGVLAALIGLRECPCDPMFGGVILSVEDLLTHARRVESAIDSERRASQADRETSDGRSLFTSKDASDALASGERPTLLSVPNPPPPPADSSGRS